MSQGPFSWALEYLPLGEQSDGCECIRTTIIHFTIFGVSESRFTSYVSDEVFGIPNYSILRRDADEPGHTRISVYVHVCILDFIHRRNDLESVYVESVWLQVKAGKGPPFISDQNSKHHNEICFLMILTLICSNLIHHGYQLCPCLTYTNVYNPRQE